MKPNWKRNLTALLTLVLLLSIWPTAGFSVDGLQSSAGKGSSHAHRHTSAVKTATCTEAGGVIWTCKGCGDSYTEEAYPALGHNYVVTTVKATCTSGGYTAHSCSRCSSNYKDNETPAKGHSWGQGQINKSATETTEGEMTYRCLSCGATKTETIPPLQHQHSYGAGVETKAPSCTEAGERTYTCSCKKSYTVKIPAKGHNWQAGQCQACQQTKTTSGATAGHHFDDGVVTKAATCYEAGEKTYTCQDTGCNATYKEDIPAGNAGHRHKEVRTNATCTKAGSITEVCEYCGDSYVKELLPALEHDFEESITEATCTKAGENRATCKRCGLVVVTTEPKLEHHYIKTVKDPTCIEIGYTIQTCKLCGDSYVEAGSQKDLVDHEYRRITVRPTCTEKGYTVQICNYCQRSNRLGETPATGHSYGAGMVETYATSRARGVKLYCCENCNSEKRESLPRLTNPFADIQASQFYYEPVLWAANYGITQGVASNSFGPELACTRAQVVTFLWRAAGEPAPRSLNCPFTDVKAGEYYYEAMLWAVENGITNGMTETTFEPNTMCTRAQVVTFIWRTAGKPAASSRHCPFTDVREDYYYEAMLWAVDRGITNGMTETTFEPARGCIRGQVATFLYRYYT